MFYLAEYIVSINFYLLLIHFDVIDKRDMGFQMLLKL